MSVTTANLKLMIQRRSSRLWYIIMLAVMLPGFIGAMIEKPVAGKGRLAFYLVASLFGGILSASLAKDVLVKPFSFCLPNHEQTPRRMIIFVGVILNGLLGLIFLLYPGLTALQTALAVTAAAALGLTVFLWAAFFVLETRRGAEFIGFLPIILMGAVFFDGHVAMEYIIINAAIPIFILTAASLIATWSRLGGRQTQRRHCGTTTVSVLDNWNFAKQRRIRKQRRAENIARLPEHEGGFLEQTYERWAQLPSITSAKRYILGTFYELFGSYRVTSLGKTFFWILVLMLFFGYYLSGRAANMIFVYPLMICEIFPLPIGRTLLLPTSRKDRLSMSGVIILALSLISVAVIAVICGISGIAVKVLPPLTLKGVTFTYHPLNPAHLYAPVLAFLIGFLLKTILRDKQIRVALICFLLPLGFLTLPALTSLGPLVITSIIAGVALWLYLALRKQTLKGVLVEKI